MKVVVKNPLWTRRDSYFFHIEEFVTYVGDEVKPGKWEDPNEVLCMTTGNDNYPVRSILRDSIISIDGRDFVRIASKNKTETKIVRGSRGEEYVVTLGKKKSCTCPGFTFRKTCKHLGEK
jgi:hypothetical protein